MGELDDWFSCSSSSPVRTALIKHRLRPTVSPTNQRRSLRFLSRIQWVSIRHSRSSRTHRSDQAATRILASERWVRWRKSLRYPERHICLGAEIVHPFSVSRFEHRANVLQVAGVSRPCCQQVTQIALAKWFRCDGGLISRSITCELMMPSVKQMRQTSRPSFLGCTETRSSQPFWQSGNFAWG